MELSYDDIDNDNWETAWDEFFKKIHADFGMLEWDNAPDSTTKAQKNVEYYSYLLNDFTSLPEYDRTDDEEFIFHRETEELHWEKNLDKWKSVLISFLYQENAELKEKLATQG